MSNQFAPNGVSFNQIKKDAKKIKKTSGKTYLESLDIATQEKTKFTSWKNLDDFVKNQGGTLARLTILNTHQVLYKHHNIVSIDLSSGRGKTLNLIKLMHDNHDKYNKIAFLNNEMSISALFKHLKSFKNESFEGKVTIYDSLELIPSDIDLLVVDDFNILMNGGDLLALTHIKSLEVPVFLGVRMMRSRIKPVDNQNFDSLRDLGVKYPDVLLESGVVISETDLRPKKEFTDNLVISNKFNK